jgi:hypothetical protein
VIQYLLPLKMNQGAKLPKSSGTHAEERSEILTGMYAQGSTSIEDSRIRVETGREGGRDTVSVVGSKVAALAMSTQVHYLPT